MGEQLIEIPEEIFRLPERGSKIAEPLRRWIVIGQQLFESPRNIVSPVRSVRRCVGVISDIVKRRSIRTGSTQSNLPEITV